MCKTQLEEDLPEGDVIDARSVLSRLAINIVYWLCNCLL